MFRPVRSDILSTDAKTHFIKLDFINKGIDPVNLPSILRSKSVIETVPTYFKEKEPPIISYTYTKTIANKIFNFSSTLSDLDYPKYREPFKKDWDKNLSLLCEAVNQYALQWVKRETVQLSVLSSKGQIEERISKLKLNFKLPNGKVLRNADVKACLSDLHGKYVLVPADKAPNNVIIM